MVVADSNHQPVACQLRVGAAPTCVLSYTATGCDTDRLSHHLWFTNAPTAIWWHSVNTGIVYM